MATSNNSSVTLIARGNIKPNTIAVGGGKGGVSNYELLTHKPSINGHELIGNKTNADLGIPTDTQDLTNTAGFITKLVDDLVNYYTKLEIDDIINQIKQSSFRIVDDLPLIGDPGVIYLILNVTPQSRNYYDEYIYIDSRWEKIGTTEIDLSGYVTDEELTQVLRNYITNETLNETLRNYYNKVDVNLLLAGKANSADLAAVATSGSYDDLQNKPVIPNKLADLTEDATHRTVTDSEKTTWNNKSDFSGSYEDLTNKPDIPDELADLSEDSTHRVVTDIEKETWNNKSDFSGSYNDLTDKPNIPTVYNSTITIKKNNQNIDSFTLNQSSNKSINMDVPEKTSDIQNDSGFITNTVNNLANYYLKSETYTKTEVSNLINAAVSGRFQKVSTLPAQGEANVIYLVPKATVLVDNIYDEYIWEDGSWELIGDTQIDLSGYVTDADLTTALQNYVTSATFNTTISNYYTKTEVGNLLADKVDKVDGKGLSTYDYDAAAKAIVDSTIANLATKVDKVDGKGLSSNDYTTTEKTKLSGIAPGAEVNVQSDWNQTDTSSDDFIKNKPTKVSQFTNDSGFTKIESSETNGNIKIDTVETQVYDDSEIQEVIDTSSTETAYANPLSLETMRAQLAKNTKIKLLPIQDLHGYDKPWVGGAGKNLLTDQKILQGNEIYFGFTDKTDTSQYTVEVSAGTYTFSFTATDGNTTNLYIKNAEDISESIVSGGITNNYTFTIPRQMKIKVWVYKSSYTSVNIIETAQIEQGSEVTTYEPYSNICPISGHDQIDILGCGDNIYDYDNVYNGYFNTSANVMINSTAGSRTVYAYLEAGSYRFEKIISSTFRYGECDSEPQEGVAVSNIIAINADNTSYTFTLTEAKWVAFFIVNANFASDIQFSSEILASVKIYNINTNLSIDLSSTVYGGVLDLESGEVVVDYAHKILTLSDIQGVSSGSSTDSMGGKRINTTILDAKYCGRMSELSNIISNCLETVSAGKIYNQSPLAFCCSVNDAGQITIRVNGASTVEDAQSYVTNNEIQVCYELVTPITIQLTPHQLNLLKAQNNLTTSQYTQIKVTYRNGVFATLEPATDLTAGLMSAMDKLKLDSIVPATTTTDGLMTATDKTKLDGVATSATKTESSTTNGNIKINDTETQVYDDSEIKGELSTDTTTIEGNPLNFTTLSAQTAKSTILSVEPIQDLHGYDKPWPGGAGKNKLPLVLADIKSANTEGTWSNNTYTVNSCNFTVNTDSNNNVISIEVSGTPSETSFFTLYNKTSPFPFSSTHYIANGCPSGGSVTSSYKFDMSYTISGTPLNLFTDTGRESGANVDFSDLESATEVEARIVVHSGASLPKTFYPMIRLATEADATFEPYTNECGISGRTEIGILGCGKNLFDEANPNLPGKIVDLNGNLVDNANFNTFRYDGKKSYVFQWVSGTNFDAMRYGVEKDGVITRRTATASPIVIDATNYDYIYISIATDSAFGSNYKLELGSNATTYEPYTKSNNLTISLGQTVYGGTLDVENGVLVADRKTITLNGSESTWESVGGSYPQTYRLTSNTAIDGDASQDKFFVNFTNKYPKLTENNPQYGMRFRNSHPEELLVYDARFQNDLTNFLAELSTNNLQFCYYLATPITINLTPHTINLLKGVNNISTDGDKITLTYRDGKVATLGDLTSAVDNLDSKIDESKILTDTATGDKYILVVTNGVLSVEQISN